jgi:hypothetical protein
MTENDLYDIINGLCILGFIFVPMLLGMTIGGH